MKKCTVYSLCWKMILHDNETMHKLPSNYCILFSSQIKSLFLLWLPWILRMHRPAKITARLKASAFASGRTPKPPNIKERSSKSLLANVLDIDDDFRLQRSGSNNAGATAATISGAGSTSGYVQLIGPSIEGTPTSVPNNSSNPAVTPCLSSQRELSAILREIRFITQRMRDDDATQDIISEWKFAGMVVDRVCLILFTAFTVMSTCVCLFSAPHLMVWWK